MFAHGKQIGKLEYQSEKILAEVSRKDKSIKVI